MAITAQQAAANPGTAVPGAGSNPVFTTNPVTQGGSGLFGQVPGPIGVPPVAQQLGQQIPGLSQENAAASGDILSNLTGTLSPGTENALANASATYGVTSGMPGSGLTWNSLYGNIANAATNQENSGLSEYEGFTPTVSGTQTVSPQLQTEVAFQNAVDAASPNPVDVGVGNLVSSIIGSSGSGLGSAAASCC